MRFKVGQGIDVHPFAPERPLILGGVRIAESGGLEGHSDADAVLHAVVDAYLGALSAGDIGQYFPSTDERWRGADSKVFMAEACRLLASRRGRLVNIDITIIAQKPKLSPHREAIRTSVAALLSAELEDVSVKATTTDHLGFIGREEGVCVMAIGLFEIRGPE